MPYVIVVGYYCKCRKALRTATDPIFMLPMRRTFVIETPRGKGLSLGHPKIVGVRGSGPFAMAASRVSRDIAKDFRNVWQCP